MDLLGSLCWVVSLLFWASWSSSWGSGWLWLTLGYSWCWALVVVGRHTKKFPCKSTQLITLFILTLIYSLLIINY